MTKPLNDKERLDWLGDLAYTKSRMDNVLGLLGEYDIRTAIDEARRQEREAWLRRQTTAVNHPAYGGTR